MARRGGPARRMPGNPLGGMLRDLDRRTRTPSRKVRQAGIEPPAGPPGPPGPAGPPGADGVRAAAAVVTGVDGRARWSFPSQFAHPPVLTALPVDPEPGGDGTVLVALEAVTEEFAVVRVWRTRPLRGQGVVEAAGAGLLVHLTAVALAAG